MDVRVKHRLASACAVVLQDVVLVQLERDRDALDERENLGQLRVVEVVQVRRVPAREEHAVAGGARLSDAQDADRARALRHERQPRRAGRRLAEQATAGCADVRSTGTSWLQAPPSRTHASASFRGVTPSVSGPNAYSSGSTSNSA